MFIFHFSVADPGFPVGGLGPRRGAWTPEAVTFRKICMSKRKNRDPLGGPLGWACQVRPLDPPMSFILISTSSTILSAQKETNNSVENSVFRSYKSRQTYLVV